jgi:hypothetical protein
MKKKAGKKSKKGASKGKKGSMPKGRKIKDSDKDGM